jgi:hypothetical protein
VITNREIVIRGIARDLDPLTTRVTECAMREVVMARPDRELEEA